jgi:hypothetical protein
MGLDRVGADEQLRSDLGGSESSLGQPSNPQLGFGQRVRVDPVTALPPVCQPELVAGFLRPALGATPLREFQGAPQQWPRRAVLTGSPQLGAQPVAEARFQ